jgi:hypothetical protein
MMNTKDRAIELDNGNFLVNLYGKYQPDLSFIHSDPEIEWKGIKRQELNLAEGDYSYIRGEHFVSKKGTKCFRVKEDGGHVLIEDNWGGAFNNYRGRSLPKEESLHYKRASSNGGGSGYDYAIYPYPWRYSIGEENI